MKRSLFVSAVLIASLALPFSVSAETPLNTDINDGVLTMELSADLNGGIDDIFLDDEEINTVIIDGNGYCVDGRDETALTVYGCGNVILKDITIKTSSDESPAVLLNRPDEDCGEDCALTLKTEGNVSIENDAGRAVSICNSVKIIDSELKAEGGITASDSEITFENSDLKIENVSFDGLTYSGIMLYNSSLSLNGGETSINAIVPNSLDDDLGEAFPVIGIFCVVVPEESDKPCFVDISGNIDISSDGEYAAAVLTMITPCEGRGS